MKETKDLQDKVSAEQKLAVLEAVDARLANLPAGTYQLIEQMVEKRVASYAKMYQTIGIVLVAAVTLVLGAFYKITSDNAAETVAKTIAATEVKKQVLEIEKLFTDAQGTKNKLVEAAVDGLNASETLKLRVRQTESLEPVLNFCRINT